jgi:hypothetical protein
MVQVQGILRKRKISSGKCRRDGRETACLSPHGAALVEGDRNGRVLEREKDTERYRKVQTFCITWYHQKKPLTPPFLGHSTQIFVAATGAVTEENSKKLPGLCDPVAESGFGPKCHDFVPFD